MENVATGHVGIDIGKQFSHVAKLTADGVLTTERVRTDSLPRWFSSQPASRVVMEACTQSRALALAARAAGHEVVVVPGAFVRALGVGARGIKTDDRDAECLAYASLRNVLLPSSHLRSEASQERMQVISARDSLVRSRRSLGQHVKSWLRAGLISVKGRANTPEFAPAVRRVAQEHGIAVPMAIDVLLGTFVHLCEQIERLDEQIERFTESDPVCRRLMQMPGVGPVIAYAFTAQLDDPARFGNADELASYLALVPGEATTGGKIKRTGTIKAGPTQLKAMLIQGAWSMWRAVPNDPIVVWGRSIEGKRGSRIAVVAMARKMATILWSMWKHGTSYDPMRASSARAEPKPASAEAKTAPHTKHKPRLPAAESSKNAPPNAANSRAPAAPSAKSETVKKPRTKAPAASRAKNASTSA
jgi:transposase